MKRPDLEDSIHRRLECGAGVRAFKCAEYALHLEAQLAEAQHNLTLANHDTERLAVENLSNMYTVNDLKQQLADTEARLNAFFDATHINKLGGCDCANIEHWPCDWCWFNEALEAAQRAVESEQWIP